MKLTWHIVLNDLRRLRLPLVLWTALLAAKLGLGAWLLWGNGAGFERVSATSFLLGAIEVVLGYVLVAWLIHGDLPTGTTAFWMTRPLSGRRLLAAKLGGLALIFGAVPLAMSLPWWLACGYGPRELALAAGETLVVQGVVVAVALPLAALTNEFSRYVMWTLVLVVALVATSMAMIVVPGMGAEGAAKAGLIATRSWLALALFLLGGGLAAMQQFCGRRLVRSIATLGSGAVVALAVLNYWPLDLSGKSTAFIDRPGRDAAGVSLALQSAWTKETKGVDAELNLALKLRGAPPNLVLIGQGVNHEWRWSDGTAIERTGWISGGWSYGPAMHALGVEPWKPNAEYEAYLAERRRQRGMPASPVREPGVRTTGIKLLPSIAARMRRDPPAYLLRAHFSLHRPVVAYERTPHAGESMTGDPHHARLVRIERNADRLAVAFVERQALLFWDVGTIEPGSGFRLRWGGWQLQPQYFLLNRLRGNAAEYSNREWHDARVATVGILWRKISFSAPRDYLGDGKFVAQSNWFDGVTLAKVVFREEERFTTELRVERFEIGKTATKEGAP